MHLRNDVLTWEKEDNVFILPVFFCDSKSIAEELVILTKLVKSGFSNKASTIFYHRFINTFELILVLLIIIALPKPLFCILNLKVGLSIIALSIEIKISILFRIGDPFKLSMSFLKLILRNAHF